MCGIFGAIHSSKLARKRMEPLAGYIHDMCVMGVLRGKDSTGMFQVKDNFDVESFKLPYEGSIFVNHDRTKRIINEADKAIITIGHHRSATFGTITQANAHPFIHKNAERYVIGVHNGHFNNRAFREDDVEFSVDSDWAYYQIFKHGARAAIPKLSGAMALVWYEDDGKLRMYSNGERSLFWGFVKDVNAMILASEHGMLWAAAHRRNIALDDNLHYPADKDTIYIFDPENPREYVTEELIKPAVVNKFPAVSNLTPASIRSLRNLYPGMVDDEEDDDIPFGPVGREVISSTITERNWPHRPLMTFQDKVINYKLEAMQALGLKQNQKLEFVPERIYGRSRDTHHIVGELMIELNGKTEVLWGLFPGVSDAVKENMEEAQADLTNISIFGHVIGVTELYVSGKPEKCLVLTNPSIITGSAEAIAFLDGSPLALPLDQQEPKEEIRDIPGPNGRKLTQKEFEKFAQEGCGHCSGPITALGVQSGAVDWIGDVAPVPVHAECVREMIANNATAADHNHKQSLN